MGTQPSKVAIPHPPLESGSQWRKWDLHIHSPASALNNQFPTTANGELDWDAYISQLEKLSDIVAVGITDYFSIDGYKKVRAYKQGGRLRNLSLVLPNIELRLNNVVYTSGGDQKPKRLNFHVLFSECLAPEVIEEHFVTQLKFNYRGTPQAENEIWNTSRKQIEDLGRRIRKEQPTFTGSDFAIGCTVVTVDVNDVKKLLEGRGSLFKDKYILVLAEESLSLISWEGQDHQVRKILLQGSDALFAASPETRNWALGLKDITPENFRSEFCTLKPCVHGSDAHSLDTIGRPHKNRYCWIKADTTFEGLKQILYEPTERVFIGEHPPNPKNDYQVIQSLTIDNAPDWFSVRSVPLNGDLVAVIGGRGSGKSALAELIAFAGGAETFKESKAIGDSFISKASKKSVTNPSPLTGAKIKLRWRSGEEREVEMKENLRHSLSDEKVKYLPQKFVEAICAPENTDQLEAEIERVIFQRIPKTDRRGASSLRELRNICSGAVQVKKRQLRSSIERLNRNIFEAFKEVNLKEDKKSNLQKCRSELQKLLLKPPRLPDVDPADQSEVLRLTARRQVVEASIAVLNQQVSTLDTIEARMSSFAADVHSFNEETATLLSSVGLGSRTSDFEIMVPAQFQEVLGHAPKN